MSVTDVANIVPAAPTMIFSTCPRSQQQLCLLSVLSPAGDGAAVSTGVAGAQKGCGGSCSHRRLVPTLLKISAWSISALDQAAQPSDGNLSYQQQGGVGAALSSEGRAGPVTPSRGLHEEPGAAVPSGSGTRTQHRSSIMLHHLC